MSAPLRCAAAVATCLLLVLATAPSATAALPNKKAWVDDVAAAMDGSHRQLDRRLEQGGSRLAINFDIDNTTLASHYDPGAAVRRVLRYATYADSHGVSILFNTARLTGGGRMTKAKQALRRAGYPVAGICGRRDGEGLVHSKTRCRRHYVDLGYTLVANVGNRATDFEGGYYERAYRLPNYDNQLT